jgi:hypothetical protein
MRAIACAVAALIAGSAHAQTVIYDTFNADEQNLFDCCNVLPITNKKSEVGVRSAIAIPFTAEADGKITGIDVALSDFGTPGVNRMKIEVVGSAHGLPGREKHHFIVREVPAGGQCCTFIAETATGIPIKAGGHYWILVKGVGDINGGWNLNTTGASGPYAKEALADDGWTMTEGPLPAVRITVR